MELPFAQKTYSNPVPNKTFEENKSATDLLQAYSSSEIDRVAFRKLINESNFWVV